MKSDMKRILKHAFPVESLPSGFTDLVRRMEQAERRLTDIERRERRTK